MKSPESGARPNLNKNPSHSIHKIKTKGRLLRHRRYRISPQVNEIPPQKRVNLMIY